MTLGHVLTLAQKEHLRTEMEVFLSSLLGVDRLDLIARRDEEVPVEHLAALQKGWLQIQDGVPVAYLTHCKEFYGLNFYVDERVLVPRPCTELLVDWAAEVAVGCVLEVGTGSGAIALALKHKRPDLQVTATDVSAEALEVANKNCVQLGLEVEFLESDLLDSVRAHVCSLGCNFDTLVTNLPYIGTVEHAFVEEKVQKHEPSLALFGGSNGLALYERLFEQIRDGVWGFKFILGEIGFSQAEDLKLLAGRILPEYALTLRQDLEGLDRHFLLERK